MKGSRSAAVMLLLSLALICFISAPAFSIEDPWDVDGDGNDGMGGFGDVGLPDTSEIVIEDPLPFHGGTSSTSGWFWIDLTYTIAKQLIFGGNTTACQVSAEVGGDTSAR